MQLHTPDPAYAGSEQARANFRLAVKSAASFVGLLWFIHLLNWALDLGPEDFGVRPRVLAGLIGILFAPLVHGGFAHLIASSLPMFVVGTAMLYLYPRGARQVLPAVYPRLGVAVWLFARGVLPIEPGVSWETHLAAAVIGLALAIALRGLDIPPRRRYAWEDEKEYEVAVALIGSSRPWHPPGTPQGVRWFEMRLLPRHTS